MKRRRHYLLVLGLAFTASVVGLLISVFVVDSMWPIYAGVAVSAAVGAYTGFFWIWDMSRADRMP